MANRIDFNADYPVIEESNKLYKRAGGLIPAYTQTLAKGPGQYVKGIAPVYLAKGKGAKVWDVDGNEYLDFNMGIGPISLGYCYESVDASIKNQLENGITFSLMHPLEVEVAELIREVIPNAESVRFTKSGAEATSAAVRLSRAYTGKNKVLCCGYHGWHDWYIGITDRNKGIPQSIMDMTFTFNYNDIQSVRDSIDNDTACVILEPVVFEEPRNNFLHDLKKVCEENNTLLIFDEMWTGFRLNIGGAQNYFGVIPDLAVYSKAIANGMPIGVITGKKHIMQLFDKEVFFFSTFGGEALSLAAVKATINELREKNVPEYIARLGSILKKGINNLIEDLKIDFVSCTGFNCRTIVNFTAKQEISSLAMKSLVQQELIKRGILWSGFHNLSYSHTEEQIKYTLSAYSEVLKILKEAVDNNNIKEYLRGEPVEPVFRKTGNFNMKPKLN